MRITIAAAGAALLLVTLTACSNGGRTATAKSAPTPQTSKPAPSSTLQPLAPKWTPKLDAADKGAVAACATPSSDACGHAVTKIMDVVSGIEKDTSVLARGPYPQTDDEIGKMRDAETTYLIDHCQGDPAADDPNSDCSQVVAITVGATTLEMALKTDDLSQ